MTNYKYTAVVCDHAADLRILNSTFEKVNWAMSFQYAKRVLVSGNRVVKTGQHWDSILGQLEVRKKGKRRFNLYK